MSAETVALLHSLVWIPMAAAAALCAFALFPVPLWVSRLRRAFRRRPRQDVDDLGPPDLRRVERVAPQLGALLRDARIVRAVLERTVEVAPDASIGARFSRLRAWGSETWASDVVREFDNARAEGVSVVWSWIESAASLGAAEQRVLDDAGVTAAGVAALVPGEPGRPQQRVEATRLAFAEIIGRLATLEQAVLRRAADPYRV